MNVLSVWQEETKANLKHYAKKLKAEEKKALARNQIAFRGFAQASLLTGMSMTNRMARLAAFSQTQARMFDVNFENRIKVTDQIVKLGAASIKEPVALLAYRYSFDPRGG